MRQGGCPEWAADMMAWVRKALSSRLVQALLLAQVLSFLLAVTGSTSTLLAAHGINMPTTQSCMVYLLLLLTCGLLHLRQRGWQLSNHWGLYLLLSVLDVEGNALLVKAYQYTSITSVALLDCFTVPAVMVLSYAALSACYRRGHLAGAALTVAGLTLLVVSDASGSDGGSDSSSVGSSGSSIGSSGSIGHGINISSLEGSSGSISGGSGGFVGAAVAAVAVLARGFSRWLARGGSTSSWGSHGSMLLLGGSSTQLHLPAGALRLARRLMSGVMQGGDEARFASSSIDLSSLFGRSFGSSDGDNGLLSTADAGDQRLRLVNSSSSSSSSSGSSSIGGVLGAALAQEAASSQRLFGDLLVVCGAMLYAINNVAQEALLAGGTSTVELLAMLGLCGSIVSGLQATLLERDAWTAATWDVSVIGPLLGFGLALYSFYIIVPRVLLYGSSTLLNLSLLTSDFWAAAARVLFFGGFGGSAGYFAAAFIAESVGLLIYSCAGDTGRRVPATAAPAATAAGAAVATEGSCRGRMQGYGGGASSTSAPLQGLGAGSPGVILGTGTGHSQEPAKAFWQSSRAGGGARYGALAPPAVHFGQSVTTTAGTTTGSQGRKAGDQQSEEAEWLIGRYRRSGGGQCEQSVDLQPLQSPLHSGVHSPLMSSASDVEAGAHAAGGDEACSSETVRLLAGSSTASSSSRDVGHVALLQASQRP